MATAKLYRSLILVIYLKVCLGQQNVENNQNYGANNLIGLQQQSVSRQNSPNNVNQIPNGGFNMNLSQQPNMQQNNLPPSNSGPGSLQQSMNLPGNFQQGTSIPSNMPMMKQGFNQVLSTSGNNPTGQSMQYNNGGSKQMQQQAQNVISNLSQLSNIPFSSTTLAELAALKGQSSLLSLLSSQANGPSQQIVSNQNPVQNQLTDVQKQFMVKALQSQSPPQNQPTITFIQSPPKTPCPNSQQNGYGNNGGWSNSGCQAQLLTPQQPQQITVTPLGNQPPYITVQAQPLSTYLQKQEYDFQPSANHLNEGYPSLYSVILSELQTSNPEYNVYNSYQPQKKSSKSNLKTLIPLIIEMLKEKKCCKNCGCSDNGSLNSLPDPLIFGGYANQKNYSQQPENSIAEKNDDKESKKKSKNKKYKKNVESEEVSEEDDSEYIDESSE